MKINGILKPMGLLVAVMAMAAATAAADASQQASAYAIRISVPAGGGSGAPLRCRLAIDDPSWVREEEAVTITLVFTIGSGL